MKPRILITGSEDKAAYLEPYALAVRLAGGDAELGWPSPDVRDNEHSLKQFLKRYRGILLPGGADIDPRFYGENRHEKLGAIEAGLDEGQLAVARMALTDDWPTLAICRGMQVMAVAAGASLYQDLPSEWPSPVNHQPSQPKETLTHQVEVLDGSRLAKLSASDKFPVNSRHHQAVREGPVPGQVGPLHAVAWAPDEVIEGMEHPTHPFLVGVQWHPEDLVGSHRPSQWLFLAFIEACRV